MRNRRSLRQGLSPLQQALRALAFPTALAAGFFLGWRFFLAPEPSRLPLETPTSTTPRSGASPTLEVVPTGRPASSLGRGVRLGQPAPDFTLRDLSGNPHTLSDHRGRVVVINFWATWCPPCRVEMPALQDTYETYRDQGVVVLAVNLTQVDELDAIEPYRQELGLTFPILLDSASEVSNGLYRVLGIPTSVFVDRDGVVQEVFVGAIPLEELDTKIRNLLGGSS